MGNQIALKNPDELIKILLPHLSYTKTLSDAQLVKTTMCSTSNEGYILAKFFMDGFLNYNYQIQIDDKNQRSQAELLSEELKKMKNFESQLDLRKNPNVLALNPSLITKENQLFLIAQRQYVYLSLLRKTRNKIPKLTLTEKKWLIFQLLCAVCQIHQQDFKHGDIKPENILITSSNQLFLTDLVFYKPAFIEADDLRTYTLYFGELENHNRCYFAPERFCDKDFNKDQRNYDNLIKSMDIFSVGCVIAEIMMDGVPLFDRSRLLSYKKKTYNPITNLKKKIHEPALVELILKMIELEENNRPTIEQSLQILLDQNQLPQSFYKQLYQISSAFIRPQYLFSDMKISLLRKYMNKIWSLCFYQKEFPKFLEPIEREIQLKINEDGIQEHNYQLIPNFESNKLIVQSDINKVWEINEARDSGIIIINWIGTFMPTCFYPQTRRCALEMLMLIGKQSSLQVKLQIILPYILKMFEDKQPKVQAKAIQAAILIFENFASNDLNQSSNLENQQLSSMDYRVFSNFIMPQFKNLLEKKQYKDIQIVQLTLSKYLPLLSKIGQRFTELSVASRLQRKYQHQQICGLLNQDKINLIQDNDNQLVGEEDEDLYNLESEVYFQETEQSKTIKQNHHQEHDHQEAQVNFDQEIDLLRKEFNQINSDYVNSNDISIKRILFSRIGQQCDFFGSKMTMDSLVPLLLTCANEKEFKIKIDCLKSVISVGIKVGKLAFTQHMLPVYLTFLNESDELVLLQFVRTLSALIKMNLINKQTIFPDYQKSQLESNSHIEYLLPFLLHPNCWIREETLNLILNLFDYQNSTIFNKTEVFCLLRSKIQPYLAQRSSIFLLMNGKNSLELLEHLQQPLSRGTFEMYIQQDNKSFDNQNEFKQSKNDTYALQYMKEFLQQMKIQNQKKAYINSGSKTHNSYQKNRQEILRLYRVINIQLLEVYKLQQNQNKVYDLIDYSNKYFQSCNFMNHQKINQRLSEIDYIMQALNLHPDYQKIYQSEQINNQQLLTIQNQSLPAKWSLQIEKIGYQSGSPSEIPQYHPLYSKTTSFKVEQQLDKVFLGQQRNQIEKFRPKGRLITTLHEHQNPVTSVSVTEDQQLFMTSSREDGKICIWSTIDVLKDPTSNSIVSIDQNVTQCKINKICSIDNSRLFCIGGSDASLQIYDIVRIQSQYSDQSNKKQSNDKLRQKIVPVQKITNKNQEHKDEGDILTCINTILPVSHQHIISYTSSNGSFFMHDLRCRKPFLKQKELFQKQKGMVTCMSLGQDPYQLLCGSVGGYVSVYDIRYNLVSSSFKYSHKYPITSIAAFKPQDKLEFPNQFTNLYLNKTYNKSNYYSPLALVSLGGPKYELSLLNLDTGDIEILMTVQEASNYNEDNQNQQIGIQIPQFLRESYIRDSFSWPEKSENNQSLYKRLEMQTKSVMNSHQIKLNRNIDDELFKGSKSLYKLLKESSESTFACRKILIPRRNSSLLQSTQTVDYAITGGNDMRLRYWNLTDPTNLSYYINTPNNDECQYFSSQVAGGIQYIREQINIQKNFPIVNAIMFQENQNINKQGNKIQIPQSAVEISDDSIYHNILADIIKQKMQYSQDYDGLKTQIGAKNLLGQSIINEISQNQSNRFQIELGSDKVNVLNYNGLSEWQHFNGIHLNEGNSSLHNSSYNDKWSNSKKQNQASSEVNSKINKNDNFYDSQLKQYRQGDQNSAFDDKNNQSIKDYVFRESSNVSHSDAVLDLEIIEVDIQSINYNYQGATGSSLQNNSNSTLLISCGRDCSVKIWQ